MSEMRADVWMKQLVAEMNQKRSEIQSVSEKDIEKQHKRHKLTARERIAYLIDEGSVFSETGSFVGYEMYEDYGGCPGGGLVAGIGKIEGRQCVIIANDQTVKAGAWFPATTKKFLRMQEIAMENHLPVIYLVDSAGVFLPLQDEVFPDKEHFGRVFYNNARMSAMGITQISAVMGPCVAGGAYLPIMSDETLMVKGNGNIFLAGPYLVKAAIGEEVDKETLGGATTHTEISGIADYKFDTEQECLDQVRKIISKLTHTNKAGFDRTASTAPKNNGTGIYSVMTEQNTKPYDTMLLIESIVDENSFTAFKDGYGQTMLCGYARIDGWAVGIVANNRLTVKNRKGEMQLGGVIYGESADKAARFILNCNQKKIPLVFLQDVTGFMVGSRSEHSGITKDGAKLVQAVSNSIVPKITVITGNGNGAGYYALCGKAYDPRFIYMWPSGKVAVMGGKQASTTLLQIQTASLKAKGLVISPEEEKSLLLEIQEKYERQTTPYYAAARLWVDEIIDPADTRMRISDAISMANENAHFEEFKTGVFQV